MMEIVADEKGKDIEDGVGKIKIRQMIINRTRSNPFPLPVYYPSVDCVNVKILSSGLNYPDLMMLADLHQNKQRFPFVPGFDACGIIDRIGRLSFEAKAFLEKHKITLGSRVMFNFTQTMQSMAYNVPVINIYPVPDHWTDHEAASFSLGAQTAHFGLVTKAKLKKGEHVLINGATGGMGFAAFQMAKALGAASIICTGGSDEKLKILKDHGATEVFKYDDQFSKKIKKRVNVVFDTVGSDSFQECLKCAEFEARVCIIGFMGGLPYPKIATNYILIKGLTIIGCEIIQNKKICGYNELRSRQDDVIELVKSGKLDPPHVSHVFPLNKIEVQQAFRTLKDRQVIGRVCISFTNDLTRRSSSAHAKL